MNAAAMLLLLATVPGGQGGDSTSARRMSGATESSSTVYVTAKSEAHEQAHVASAGTAPPVKCMSVKDPSFEAPAPTRTEATDGSWYRWQCGPGAASQNLTRIPRNDLESWVPKPPASPRDVAQEAVKQIHLPAPAAHLSPNASSPQWVNFPTFLWTDGAAWHPLSATAAVPGLSVSATATPIRLTWDMGDGTTVTCTGPGTPFTDATPATASSPDCGHTYRRASDVEPSGKFTVRVTETWRVTWAGGGQSGTLPDMTATSSIAVRVAESQALVTSVR